MKKYKMYAVVWTDKGRKDYGVPKEDNGIILLDETEHYIMFNSSEKKIGRPKMRTVDIYPFFATEKEAEAYRANNEDFETVKVYIHI